ncbi:tRNA (5-methylaminomethyl-2-thiouridine)(34)-methyltransferase MnmD [Flavobacterium sp.]|uniref:tRNA (5-methylaminomethyl-2-thiouridine)(34)-methyltransferase MnmD n=1 Tax=Flavobacterium sp. TaxID=239 RepID=UPI004033CCBD
MERQIITTDDGSVTIYLPEMKETYHSKFGAIQEANHVFIQNGLALTEGRPVAILEIGFGTGLNAFITFLEAAKSGQQVDYTGVEAYPVGPAEAALLNYVGELKADRYSGVFTQLHASEWEEKVVLTANFSLTKRQQFFNDITDTECFDLIYFDAFGYPSQPELWSVEIFQKMYNALRKDGILVTYACRTVIKKAMQEAGFVTEKLPGPPGKREILRAIKL